MVIRSTNITNSLEVLADPEIVDKHDTLIEASQEIPIDGLRIQHLTNSYRISAPAILVDEVYTASGRAHQDRPTMGSHLVVLVHGYQGNTFDMKVLKSNFSASFPHTTFLSSALLESHTNESLWELGEKLAKEITDFIADWCQDTVPSRISFIGHSLGGLIIRAALPHLMAYKESFFFYMSLASPHMGYMRNESKIVATGLWFMKQRSESL